MYSNKIKNLLEINQDKIKIRKISYFNINATK